MKKLTIAKSITDMVAALEAENASQANEIEKLEAALRAERTLNAKLTKRLNEKSQLSENIKAAIINAGIAFNNVSAILGDDNVAEAFKHTAATYQILGGML